jgi:hypothetical protein
MNVLSKLSLVEFQCDVLLQIQTNGTPEPAGSQSRQVHQTLMAAYFSIRTIV